MNRKQFFLVLMALIIVGSAGLILAHRNRDAWLLRETKTGDKVFPDFHINDVASIHVDGDGSSFNIIHTNDLWCVQERDGYPANLPMIRDFLLKVRDLKVVRSDLVGPSQLPRLNLAPPRTEKNSGTLVEFKDQHGNLLASLLAGKLHPKPQNDAEPLGLHGLFDGRYILLPADPGYALLISDDLVTITTDPGAWLSPDFFKAENIKFISLASTNSASSWEISRANDSSPWGLDNAGPCETLNIKTADDVGEILAFPSFTDVTSKASSRTATQGLDKPIIVTVLTDHFVYTLNVGREQPDGNYPMTVGVKGNIPANDSDAPELQEKLAREQALSQWVYEAGPWIKRVIRTRSDLLDENTAAREQARQ